VNLLSDDLAVRSSTTHGDPRLDIPMKKNPNVIQIWRCDQVPQYLKRLSGNSAWVALIPPDLVRHESEALFLDSHADQHPVIRRILADGSILFLGWHDDDKP
jgi:hypothetical protein